MSEEFAQGATEEVVASFTAEQLVAHDMAVNTAKYGEGHQAGYRVGIDHGHNAYRNAIKEVLKDEVSEDNLDRDTATNIFNLIATKVGQSEISSIGGTYTVTVSVFGNDVLEVSSVEAESEDEACDKVTEDIDFSDSELSFNVSFGHESNSGSVNEYDYDFADLLRDNMEVSATEE